MDRVQAMGEGSPQGQVQKDQMAQFNVSLQQYKDALRNLGMGRRQVEEIISSRKYAENIDITSPGYGIILARNLSDGQRFVKGEQFFKIGDLRRVWVLIDVYQNEADQLKTGMTLKVTLPQRQRSFTGKVSPVPPIFDPVSRTLKVRLYVDNPGMVLRPDMFVDVELPISLPEMLSVQAEAVLDSGMKKTVFVEKSVGVFEPREVETGRSFGNRVEIVSGLKAGERIAVSGTFLLDSESRMKTAAAGITSTPQIDPACGMYVDEAKSRAAGLTVESGGVTRYFCSDECRRKFLKKPAANTAQQPRPASATPSAPVAPMTPHDAGHKHD
jgi:Cu(I)/Ag(I) efflux system membrane fusion protein